LISVHQKKLLAMKTTEKKTKKFDTVKTFRDIKNNISKDIQNMTFDQLKEYLNASKLNTKSFKG